MGICFAFNRLNHHFIQNINIGLLWLFCVMKVIYLILTKEAFKTIKVKITWARSEWELCFLSAWKDQTVFKMLLRGLCVCEDSYTNPQLLTQQKVIPTRLSFHCSQKLFVKCCCTDRNRRTLTLNILTKRSRSAAALIRKEKLWLAHS